MFRSAALIPPVRRLPSFLVYIFRRSAIHGLGVSGLTLLALAAQTGWAQVPSITGSPPFVTIAGNVDAINAVNLNVHLEVPVVHRAGRKFPFTYNLSYDSTVY